MILAIDPGPTLSAFVLYGDERVPPRIWNKIQPCPMSGCWIWTSSTHRLGYGDVWWQGARRYAHRVMFVLTRGSIAEGTEIDHLCRVRACCNPAHLEPVTHAENMRRAELHRARPQTCLRGHAFDRIQTRPDGSTYRACRTCMTEVQRRYAARKAASGVTGKRGRSE